MKQTLLNTILAILTLCAVPVAGRAAQLPEEASAEAASAVGEAAVTIEVKGHTLYVHVQNAAGETLEVYNLTGVKVASYKVDGADRQFSLNLGKGCYIIKVGKLVRKTALS